MLELCIFISLVMTSHGPYPFLLRACENNNWRMIVGKVPDLRGDPCKHCPGWGRAWDAKRALGWQ